MKKIIFFSVAAAAALTLASSCSEERLEIDQKGVYSESAFYKTDEDATQALAGVYSSILHSKNQMYMVDVCITCLLSDEAYKSSSGYKTDDYHSFMLSTYNSTHSYVNKQFTNLWDVVYRCNLVTDYFSEGTSATMKQAVAEAKVMRAWAYIKIIQSWGTPPLVTSVPKTTEDMRKPNATKEELWSFVISSLDEAINSGMLEEKSSVDDKTKVRATKGFALALKGKAQVISGDYAGAKTTLKTLIDSGKYALVDGNTFANTWFIGSENNHNCESLYETNTVSDGTNYEEVCAKDQWAAYCVPRTSTFGYNGTNTYLHGYLGQTWGYYGPTEKIVKAFLENEGMNSNRFKAFFLTYPQVIELGCKPFEESKTDAIQKTIEAFGSTPSKSVHSGIGKYYTCEHTGIWNKKLMIPAEDILNNNYQRDKADRHYMRYAEALLLYAEACAQLGETSGDGLKALNQIAERAGAPTYSTLNMANVKHEKMLEMWMEGCRYFDLVRWGDAPTELANHWNYVPTFYGYQYDHEKNCWKDASYLNEKGTNYYDVFEIHYCDFEAISGSKHGFRTNQDELLPFPSTEMANNINLKQNPGWE